MGCLVLHLEQTIPMLKETPFHVLAFLKVNLGQVTLDVVEKTLELSEEMDDVVDLPNLGVNQGIVLGILQIEFLLDIRPQGRFRIG